MAMSKEEFRERILKDQEKRRAEKKKKLIEENKKDDKAYSEYRWELKHNKHFRLSNARGQI